MKLAAEPLRRIYRDLLATYGPQHWWPADSPFEVVVGAVLTQNTAWRNVERALDNLRQARWLDCAHLAGAAPAALAEMLRPAGYFNLKAQRLQELCRAVQDAGGMERLDGMETAVLRGWLLGVKGVGPETADDILLYAFQRPVFVVDAYTRRILARLGLISGDEGYEELRAGLEASLGLDAPLFNEYHALLVHHAKTACSKRPGCDNCCLRDSCPSVASSSRT